MPHKIDTVKIADVGVSKAAILAAVTRLTQIETATTATSAQQLAAIKNLATYMKAIIKVLT
jgi:hypothetical protein